MRRRSGGSVSRSRKIATSSSATPSAASTANTPRHDPFSRTAAPMVGARIGATPMTSMSRDRTVAAARPENRSRTTAMATTMAAAAPTPWSTRSSPSTATFGATRHNTDDRTCTAVPMTSGSLRPTASENGPITSWPRPSPSSVPVSVSWAAADVVSRSSAIAGRAGRYMSMVSGPSAISAPSTRISWTRARPVGDSFLCSGRWVEQGAFHHGLSERGPGLTTASVQVSAPSGRFVPRPSESPVPAS